MTVMHSTSERRWEARLPVDLNNEMVALYRAWDSFERERSGDSIIDFDLAMPSEFPRLESREEVLKRLGAMSSSLASMSGREIELVQARLRASTTYLRALMGERIDFEPYIERTLGVEPRLLAEDEIEEKREQVESLLRQSRLQKVGFSFQQAYFHRFQAAFLTRETRNLPKQFKFFQEKWIPELLRHISVPLDEYRILVEFASEDAYWKNWISGNLSRHEITLKINLHPRHRWYQGLAETLVLHEYCGHAVQMVNWHRRIERNELPSFLGILTVHFPDQFVLEGLAEAVVYFLPRNSLQLETHSLVLREMHYYTLLVMNNVHILANNEGAEQAYQYAVRRLPFMEESSIHREIRDRTANPLFRCYQYVYGIAKHSFVRALSRLGTRRGWDLIKLVYDSPMIARQFEKASRELAG